MRRKNRYDALKQNDYKDATDESGIGK